jgi:hypothetical protein
VVDLLLCPIVIDSHLPPMWLIFIWVLMWFILGWVPLWLISMWVPM